MNYFDDIRLEQFRIKVMILTAELYYYTKAGQRIEAEKLLKAGYNPNQPRRPRGNHDGGQWIDSGSADENQSNPHRFNPQTDDPPLDPVYPELLIPLLRVGGGALNLAGRILQSIKKIKTLRNFTYHGTARALQRTISAQEVQLAIKTAENSGNITTKLGKYGTPQIHYKGTNGITVVIEKAGRNAGKVITLWRHTK